jgi:hypothetical protein
MMKIIFMMLFHRSFSPLLATLVLFALTRLRKTMIFVGLPVVMHSMRAVLTPGLLAVAHVALSARLTIMFPSLVLKAKRPKLSVLVGMEDLQCQHHPVLPGQASVVTAA